MWINVNDELPKVGQKVLICYTALGELNYVEGEYIGYDNVFDTKVGIKAPTHWNPNIPNCSITIKEKSGLYHSVSRIESRC